MKPPFSLRSSRSAAEAAGLLVLIGVLCGLALVQHRWLETIASAQRRALTEEATEKAANIGRDVDRELTRAFLGLRVPSRAVKDRDASSFAAQFDRFATESPHAGLVSAVYVAEPSGPPDSHEYRLLRFDRPSRSFVETAWPASLSSLRDSLPSAPVVEEVPALVFPLPDVMIDSGQTFSSLAKPARLVEFMASQHARPGPLEIIALNESYLRERLLAGSAGRHLGTSSPFTWSVVRSQGGTLVAGDKTAGLEASDATSPMLRLRFDDLDQSLIRSVMPGLPEVMTRSGVRVVVQMNASPHARAAGPGLITGPMGSAEAPWTLALRHREGSIAAAVDSQRRRNNLLSASILGGLGLSAAMVFFSARRLRALASQQVEFVAAVSHELRTPLAVIRSAADNLADGVVKDPQQAMRYGALIREESVRLTDMVEHVLEFAGADSPARAARGPISLAESVQAAVLGLRSLESDRHGAVKVDIAPDLPLINGDASNLTRAVSNLIANALKYSGDSPQVSVEVRARGGEVEVVVSDSGPGLAPSEIPHLFEPFYRGQKASEAQIPGSGLGLALVKRIAESHGGRVSASNTPKGGAAFTLSLPCAPERR